MPMLSLIEKTTFGEDEKALRGWYELFSVEGFSRQLHVLEEKALWNPSAQFFSPYSLIVLHKKVNRIMQAFREWEDTPFSLLAITVEKFTPKQECWDRVEMLDAQKFLDMIKARGFVPHPSSTSIVVNLAHMPGAGNIAGCVNACPSGNNEKEALGLSLWNGHFSPVPILADQTTEKYFLGSDMLYVVAKV